MAGVAAASASLLEAERERWASWLPVALAVGVGAFFALPFDPPLGFGVIALLAVAIPTWALRTRRAVVAVGVAVMAAAIGFIASQVRVEVAGTPMLERARGPLPIAGRLVEVERTPRGHRLTLDGVTIEGMTATDTPRRVRVQLARRWPPPPVGAMIAVRARLLPPSTPVAPGAFDFQRHAFFDGIGAVGFIVEAPAVTAAPSEVGRGLDVAVEELRERVTARVRSAVDGPAAAVTAALMDGERSAIPQSTLQAMRDSGLAHLLSISGLHIGLVAGLVFFTIRAGLALIPPVALRWPIKKIAAVGGLAAAVAYTILVGAPVPTVRASVMTGLALVAVMVGRDPFSMRLVAVAAALVMLWAPETLVGPSFQMSFAAVVALIAMYEAAGPVIKRWRPAYGFPQRIAIYLGSLALTSAVASLATAPFAAYHFQTMAVYGVLANLAAVPLTAAVVMPALLLAYALMPLGWDAPALIVAGWGVEGIIAVARWTADLPGAVAPIPAMPGWALAVIALGGCWLTIWRRAWRWWGLAPIALGMAMAWLTPRPDVLVDAGGRLVAARLADGRLSLSTARSGRFAADNWRRLDGELVDGDDDPAGSDDGAAGNRPVVWPKWGATPDGLLRCDGEACVYRRDGRVVAVIRQPASLAEECRRADVIIAAVSVDRRCGASVVIDRRRLTRSGAHALRFTDGGIVVTSVAEERGDRPWSRPPPK